MKRPGRLRATAKKIDQRIHKHAGIDNIATTGNIQSVLNRQNIGINRETIRRKLKEVGAKFSLLISKSLLIGNHRYDRLR